MILYYKNNNKRQPFSLKNFSIKVNKIMSAILMIKHTYLNHNKIANVQLCMSIFNGLKLLQKFKSQLATDLTEL